MLKSLKMMMRPTKLLIVLLFSVCCIFTFAVSAEAAEYNNPDLPVLVFSRPPNIAASSISASYVTYNGSPVDSSFLTNCLFKDSDDFSLYYHSTYYQGYIVVTGGYICLRSSLAGPDLLSDSFAAGVYRYFCLIEYNGIRYLAVLSSVGSTVSYMISRCLSLYSCNFSGSTSSVVVSGGGSGSGVGGGGGSGTDLSGITSVAQSIDDALHTTDLDATPVSVAEILKQQSYIFIKDKPAFYNQSVYDLLELYLDSISSSVSTISSKVTPFYNSIRQQLIAQTAIADRLLYSGALSDGTSVEWSAAKLLAGILNSFYDSSGRNLIGIISTAFDREDQVLDTEYQPLHDDLSVSDSLTSSDLSGMKSVGGTMLDSGGSVSSFTDSSLWSSDGDTGGLFAILTEPDEDLYSSGSSSPRKSRASSSDVIYSDDLDEVLADTTGRLYYSPYVNGVK